MLRHRPLIASAALALITLSTSVNAQNDFFNFRVMSYPFAAGQCNDAARKLAERFTTVTGAKVASYACEGQNSRGASIKITYIAEQPLHFTSTYEWGTAVALGSYKTIESCYEDRYRQWTLFQTATGVEPITAYCLRETADVASDYPYAMQVIGAGDTAKSFNKINIDLGYAPANQERFMADLKKNLDAVPGLSVANVTLRMDLSQISQLTISYYAEFTFRLQEMQSLDFSSRETCEVERTVLANALTASGQNVIASDCFLDSYGANYLRAFMIMGDRVTLASAHRDFASYQECSTKRDEIKSSLINDMGWDVSGVVCEAGISGVSAWAVRKLPPIVIPHP